jgi:putative flippase GtrA
MSKQFLRFLLTGGMAALVNLGSRYLLNIVMPFEAAVPIAYLFGMVTAYILARLYVFEKSGRSRFDEFKRFAIVNVFALFVVWAISVGLARGLFPWIGFTWHSEDIAHIIGVLSPVALSYFGHRSYTFAKTGEQAATSD